MIENLRRQGEDSLLIIISIRYMLKNIINHIISYICSSLIILYQIWPHSFVYWLINSIIIQLS